MAAHCPICSVEVEDHLSSCPACGGRLSQPAASSQDPAERRMLTVLFSDLVGSTRLSQTLDPEDMRDLLDAYQRECAGIVERYGGHVAQYLGDGILIYFGYPVAHEDAARRAVGAACEIAAIVPRIRTPASIPLLEVRIGIHTGVTVVGMMGSGQRRENLAVGGAPNVAARIQTIAPPNTVLVSETTKGLVDGYYSCEPFERELDGVQAPSRLFRVVGTTGAARSIDAAMAVGLTQFVGRADELATLQKLWSGAVEGTTQAILLEGEAGIGKSRLVQVLKARAARGSARIVEWHCSQDAQGTVFGPVAEAIARQVDVTDDSPGDERLKKLRKGLAEFGSFNDDALWLFASLLSIPPGKRDPAFDTRPQSIRKKTLEALLDLVKSLSSDHPLLLVVEDVHWADHSTLELIGLLLERLRDSRALLVLTARPEFRSPWETLTALHLERLASADVHQMIHDVARGRGLPSEILEELADRSEGVPLFIEELTRAVLESNSLADRGDRYELLLPLEGVPFPTTIQESMSARFHRLGESKRVAQVASVFGRSFSYEMIRAIDPASDGDLQRDLAELVRADFLHVLGEANDSQWTFKHAMMRETAYNSQLIKVRRELHAKIAAALVERLETGMAQPELVAHHFTQAGAVAQAAPHWIAAGQQALSRSANQEAVACLTRGLELAMQLPEGEQRANLELTMRVLIGPALMAIKGFSHSDVLSSYTRAHELLKQVGNAPQMFDVMWGLWAQHFVGGQLHAAREVAEQVVRMARTLGDPKLILPAHNALGYVECYTAHYPETVALVEEALAALDDDQERKNCLTYQFSSALALMNMGATALWMSGKPDEARKLAARARPLAEKLGHPPSTAFAIASSSWFVQLAGDNRQVQEIVEEVNRLSEHEGFDLWPPLVSVFGGWARMADGNVSAGVEIMSDGFRRYRAIGGGILRTHGMALLAEGLLEAGRISESLQVIGQALENAHSTGEVHFEPELHRVRGLALLKRAQAADGSLDEGRSVLEHALRLAHEQRALWLELRVAIALARLLRAQGDARRATLMLAPIYERITEGRDTREMREASELLAELTKA